MNAIEIAKKMETDAISFYTEAARKTVYPAGKKMFEVIIVDEKRHLEMIKKLIEETDVHIEDVHPLENMALRTNLWVFFSYYRKISTSSLFFSTINDQ